MTFIKLLSTLFLLGFFTTKMFAQPTHNSFVDTLMKYKGLDTLYKHDKVFYIGTIHSRSFGIIQTSGTSFSVFQRHNRAWYISDKLELADIVRVNYTDLNGDGFKDIIIVQDYTGAGGNSENVVLLYNHTTGLLRHNVFYDLPNIQYNKSKGLIYSAWWGSANHPQNKMVYKILGDSLLFYKGVTYMPDEQTQGETGTVEFYVEAKTKKVVTKTIKGKANKMFDIFSKTFWNTSGE